MNIDLYEMARESGATLRYQGFAVSALDEFAFSSDELEAFVRLIVEKCAVECDKRYMGDNNREDMEARKCAAAIRDLVKDEE